VKIGCPWVVMIEGYDKKPHREAHLQVEIYANNQDEAEYRAVAACNAIGLVPTRVRGWSADPKIYNRGPK